MGLPAFVWDAKDAPTAAMASPGDVLVRGPVRKLRCCEDSKG